VQIVANKCVWLFSGANAAGTISYGFSESWYSTDDQATALRKMQVVAQARAMLLPTGCAIVGYRVQIAGGRAITARENLRFQGGQVFNSSGTNIPTDAALCQALGSVAGTRKMFWIHALPDASVDDAGFTGLPPVPGIAQGFLSKLAQNGFQFQYVNQTLIEQPIQTIDATGKVTLNGAIQVIAGNTVQLVHARDINGKAVKGKFVIGELTDAAHFTLLNWPGNVIAGVGKMRPFQLLYTPIQDPAARGAEYQVTVRPGERKVGRPFFQLRGRVSARH
jgi:hypothetical protein